MRGRRGRGDRGLSQVKEKSNVKFCVAVPGCMLPRANCKGLDDVCASTPTTKMHEARVEDKLDLASELDYLDLV